MASLAGGGDAPAIRPWRLSLSTLQIVLPATVVLLALVLFGLLGAVPALLGWLLALALSAVLASLREHRLLATRQYLNDLAEGRSPRPLPSYSPLIDDDLDTGFRRLGRAFAAHNARVQEADRLLTALLDVLPDPLLVVGAGRLVLRANQAAADLFEHQPAGRPLEESLRDPGVLAGVDGALREQGEAQVTLHLPGSTPRAFGVHVVPVRLGERPVALLSLRELTEQLMIERMRSDFIANASHEIRTPLAALLGFIETLQGPARDDAAARERFLVTMASEARRMARLVDDLLSLSRIESSAHLPPEGMADLAACARSAVSALQPYAESRKVALEVELAGGLPPIRADRDQLAQLLTNLIDNAIKYGGEGKTVRLAVDRVSSAPPGAGPLTGRTAARIRVIDGGPGIAREHLPRLTERFFRVDPARSRTLGGTGLGLAIVKHILRRHRGHIAIDSELGRGTTVTVYLPSA
jgi:two-component system, OmpR family, phosphate regulon sensor histidine kinase PhoR